MDFLQLDTTGYYEMFADHNNKATDGLKTDQAWELIQFNQPVLGHCKL